jgi:hypothetical protein
MKKNDNTIEEIEKILNKPPAFIIRWGIVLIFLIVTILFLVFANLII